MSSFSFSRVEIPKGTYRGQKPVRPVINGSKLKPATTRPSTVPCSPPSQKSPVGRSTRASNTRRVRSILPSFRLNIFVSPFSETRCLFTTRDEAGVKRDTPRKPAQQGVSVPTDFLAHSAQGPESG